MAKRGFFNQNPSYSVGFFLLLERLPRHHEPHGRERPRRASVGASPAALLKHFLHLVRARGGQVQALEDPQSVARGQLADPVVGRGRGEGNGEEKEEESVCV